MHIDWYQEPHLDSKLIHSTPVVVPYRLQLLHNTELLGRAGNVVAHHVCTSTSLRLSARDRIFFTRALLSKTRSISRAALQSFMGTAVVKLVPVTLDFADCS